MISTGDAPIEVPSLLQPDTFAGFLASDQDIQWCLYGLYINNEDSLIEAIKEGAATAISDGSYKDKFGTAAWAIGDPDNVAFISGRSICPGAPCNHDAYRSELAGIYFIMTVIDKFCAYYHITEGSIVLGCDGKSALETALGKGTLLFQDIPSFDLVAAIMRLHRNSPLSWTAKFVKGHQDDAGQELDTWAQRNVLMDLGAKQHLAVAKTVCRHFSVKGEPWQLWVGGKKLTSNLASQIYSALHSLDGISYWQTKPEVTPDVVNTVDWVAIGHTMKGVSRGRRVFVTKHMSGMCGVGKFMQHWKQWEIDQCPRCEEKEDAPHVWMCKDPGAREIWGNHWHLLNSYFANGILTLQFYMF
jgi:hypothetical protein